MEKEHRVPGIDDTPVTNEQAIEMAKKLKEVIYAREALKRAKSENAAERAVV